MKGPEDDAGLTGKVAIVSGGGAVGDGIGNGRAAAILLARAGTRVLVADLDIKLAERTAEMIKAEGGHAAAHAGQVARGSRAAVAIWRSRDARAVARALRAVCSRRGVRKQNRSGIVSARLVRADSA